MLIKLLLVLLVTLSTGVEIHSPVLSGGGVVTGHAEPGATVQLTIIQDPAASAETVAGADGGFFFPGVRLEAGYIVMVRSGQAVDYALVESGYRVFVPMMQGGQIQ